MAGLKVASMVFGKVRSSSSSACTCLFTLTLLISLLAAAGQPSWHDSYDYIVVGGGTAGSVVAGRLSEDPNHSVLVLEAGVDYERNLAIEVPFAMNWLMGNDSHADWNFKTEPQKYACKAMVNQQSVWPAGKVLGGTSSINGLAYIRGSLHDYDAWAADGNEGWGYDDVLPYFKKSENNLNEEFVDSGFHGSSGPWVIEDSIVYPELVETFLNAGEEMGYDRRDINGAKTQGFMHAQQNSQHGRRMNLAKAFLKPVMYGRPNLNVWTMHLVTEIVIEDNKAMGVIAMDQMQQPIRIEAKKEVIISAGALQSPKLLMLSGIGPRDHLNDLGIPVLADLPVGDYLTDHVMTDLHFTFTDAVSFSMEDAFSFTAMSDYTFSGAGVWSSSAYQATAFIRPDTEADVTTPQTTAGAIVFECDFESGLCGFRQESDPVDDIDWTYMTGATSSVGTGPSGDHTTSDGSGHYVYLEASRMTPMFTAVISSPVMPKLDEGMCARFYYHMHGADLGSLRVEEVWGSGQVMDVWSINKDSLVMKEDGVYGVDAWLPATVDLSAETRYVRFVAKRGGQYLWHPYGDIAIDDVVITTGSCESEPVTGTSTPTTQPTTVPTSTSSTSTVSTATVSQAASVMLLQCDFDSEMCPGFSQVADGSGDDFDWIRYNGLTPSSKTGPRHDHTQGNLDGFYMYIESSGIDPDLKASLDTNVLDGSGHDRCLIFYYHMWGHHIGSLYVEEVRIGGQRVKIWDKKYSDLPISDDLVYGFDSWQKAECPIASDTMRLRFTAVRGGGHKGQPYGDIALDDIMVVSGSCSDDSHFTLGAESTTQPTTTASTTTETQTSVRLVSCSFDVDECGFTQGTSDFGDWLRRNSQTPTFRTGPSMDHTQGNLNGYYMYFEASGQNPGNFANLISSQLKYIPNTPRCLQFFYHMYGQHLGSLSVSEVYSDGFQAQVWEKTQQEIVSLTNNFEGINTWFYAQATLSADAEYVMFTAVRGGLGAGQPYGDIAIDDVQIETGQCIEQPVMEPGPGFNLGLPIEIFTCSFDRDMCGFVQETSQDDFDWTRRGGATPSTYTGPSNDHTLNSAVGSYMYIEASGRNPNDVAVLTTPNIASPSGHRICLSFYYHMWGAHLGGLYVYEMTADGLSAPLWKILQNQLPKDQNGNYGFYDWIPAQVTCSAAAQTLLFMGVRGGESRGQPMGDIAIDDVLVIDGPCGEPVLLGDVTESTTDSSAEATMELIRDTTTTTTTASPTTTQTTTAVPTLAPEPASQKPSLQIELVSLLPGNLLNNYTQNPYGMIPEMYYLLHENEVVRHGAVLMLVLLHPQSRGTVRLQGTDPGAPPRLELNYLEHEDDVKELIKGVRFVQDLSQTAAFQAIGAQYSTPHHPGCLAKTFDTDDYWECYIRHNTLSGYHYMSTCRMGQDPYTSVVDERLRVHGISSLRVADASVIPETISGNTMATTVMIGEKAADLIKEDAGQQSGSTPLKFDQFGQGRKKEQQERKEKKHKRKEKKRGQQMNNTMNSGKSRVDVEKMADILKSSTSGQKDSDKARRKNLIKETKVNKNVSGDQSKKFSVVIEGSGDAEMEEMDIKKHNKNRKQEHKKKKRQQQKTMNSGKRGGRVNMEKMADILNPLKEAMVETVNENVNGGDSVKYSVVREEGTGAEELDEIDNILTLV